MAYLIDSSILIGLERQHRSPETLAEQAGDEPIFVAAVTASELLHGVHRADTAVRRGRREAFVESILQSVPVLAFNLDVARVHARIWADLSARGETIGDHDLLIAATALYFDLMLVTRNEREFRRVPDLRLTVW